MKIINLKSVGEKLYYEKLENGLDVYVIRKKDFSLCTAQFITNFGGLDIEFVPKNEEKLHKFPAGIAHFLEHKLFEQEKGESVSDFFKKSGTTFNASTNEFRTRYYFLGMKNFEKNLEFLIDYVQSPYFTDENVEKEKGIIKEEILMCKDNPNTKFYYKIRENLFNNYPFNNTVVGEIEDINKITKEDLYKCYNTFYHPSNMCLLVVSNMDEEKVIDIIKENQLKKDYKKENNIVRKKYKEKDNVNKEFEIMYENVTEKRISYSLKVNKKIFPYSKTKILMSLYILFDVLFGELSNFNLELKEQQKITGNIGFSCEDVYEYIILNFITILNIDEKEYVKLFEKQLNNINVEKEDFEMIKKSIISSYLLEFNTVESTMNSLAENYLLYGDISDEYFKEEKELKYEEFLDIISKLNIDNKSVVIMKSNKEENLC